MLPKSWNTKVIDWLNEDIPSFDYGGFVVGEDMKTATLYCKSPGVLAGCAFFDRIFQELECQVTWQIPEGTFIDPNTSNGTRKRTNTATVSGKARNILMGERVALNLLARCSGVATRARNLTEIAKKHGYKGAIAGTRKTTPGFRLVEKYGMLVGGIDTHRMDLSSMIMLKDNHCASVGSITNAVKKARIVGGFSLKIEVECQNKAEAEEAILAGTDVVMLDNFPPTELKTVAEDLKLKHPHILIEASGGITEETIEHYLSPHVDIISLGSTTQGVQHVDFSLKVNL